MLLSFKEILWRVQAGRCWLCGGGMTINGGQRCPDFATEDHVLPRSMGGSGSLHNKRLAHRECNNKRSSEAPSEEAVERYFSVYDELEAHIHERSKYCRDPNQRTGGSAIEDQGGRTRAYLDALRSPRGGGRLGAEGGDSNRVAVCA